MRRRLISEHKSVIDPRDSMKVPVILHVNDELMPSRETLEELVKIASNEFVFHHVAVLSDVHSKKGRKNPTGTAVATKRYLLPQAIDTAPNCGMRLVKTRFGEEDLDEKMINRLFQELVKVIPTTTYFGTKISFNTAVEICRRGSDAVIKALKIEAEDNSRIFNEGNFFDEPPSVNEILQAIPKTFLRISQIRLGILGAAGNHFLDLMKVSEIKDEQLAGRFGLRKGQYLFLIHTGSGMLGQYASYFYTPKVKEHRSQKIILELGRRTFLKRTNPVHEQIRREIPLWKNREEYYAIDSESELGRMFLTAHRASANYGFANRTVLTNNIRKAIKKVFQINEPLELVYDMPHVHIQKENHYQQEVFIHRNGATRANGPKRMESHPFFSLTGEPIFIPSSMCTPFYFGVGTDENESTFFSASHGTGKTAQQNENIPRSREELLAKMSSKKVKLYNAKSRRIIDQDSSQYKNVEKVIEGMIENKIIKLVAKMEPVAVLMA